MATRVWPGVNDSEWAVTSEHSQMLATLPSFSGHALLVLIALAIWFFHRSNWVSRSTFGLAFDNMHAIEEQVLITTG